MKRLMFAAALAAFLLPASPSPNAIASGPTLAAPEASPRREPLTDCRASAHFVANLLPGERVMARLDGEAATRFMAIYNAVPPETHLQADEILILMKDGVPNVAVLRFVGGCFRDYGIHPVRFAEWLLRKAAGQPL